MAAPAAKNPRPRPAGASAARARVAQDGANAPREGKAGGARRLARGRRCASWRRRAFAGSPGAIRRRAAVAQVGAKDAGGRPGRAIRADGRAARLPRGPSRPRRCPSWRRGRAGGRRQRRYAAAVAQVGAKNRPYRPSCRHRPPRWEKVAQVGAIPRPRPRPPAPPQPSMLRKLAQIALFVGFQRDMPIAPAKGPCDGKN